MKGGLYFKDNIYFAWIPIKTDDGWRFLTWIRVVLVSNDGKDYTLFFREHYRNTIFWIFKQ